MKRTVAIVSDSGVLTDVTGTNRETSDKYAKFAKRILSSDTNKATLNYGWNGSSKLAITKDGTTGEEITLDASTVTLPGILKVNGRDLDTIISDNVDTAFIGIVGTTSETTVTLTKNTADSSDSSSEEILPRLTCKVGLSHVVLDRISVLEKTVDAILNFDDYYTIGNGLEKIVPFGGNKILQVKLGTGMKFEYPEDSSGSSSDSPSDETAAITLDMDTTPTEGSIKPVTSGGVYAAIHSGGSSEYTIGLDTSGNMVLYHNT